MMKKVDLKEFPDCCMVCEYATISRPALVCFKRNHGVGREEICELFRRKEALPNKEENK
jgi:hypothetical protein